MADHLPDDPRRWPGDPFELLGVERSASETDIKRAYTRLIRKFKPEHFPEQFRRIREAYEAALQQRKWFGFMRFGPPAEDDPAPAIVTAEDTGTETAPRDEPRELERPRPIARPEEEAWSLAIAGKRAEGYSQLAELARAKPENSELALRLYWLLAIEPAIDEDRTRHDWLAEALRRSCLRGEAVELYRRELEANPEQALLGPYENILKCDATGNDRLSLSRLRVSAAAIARKWNAIDSELEFLAREPGDYAETAWLSYLVFAMGILHFEYPPAVYVRCKHLLLGLRHLELREAWAFDQLDEQEAMARAWGSAHALPSQVLDVLRDYQIGSQDCWRRAMYRAGKWAAEDPFAALSRFDQGVSTPAAHPTIATFLRLLDECREARNEYPGGLIRGLIREFLERTGDAGYRPIRGALLRLLIAEGIDPDEVVQACSADRDPSMRWLASEVREDAVLRLVWQTAMVGLG